MSRNGSLRLGNLGRGIGRDGAPGPDALEHLRQIGSELHVDHSIHADASCAFQYPPAPIRLAVIDDMVGAGVATGALIRRLAGGRDDGCPRHSGPLDRVVADPAGAASHQDRLAGDQAIGVHAAVRGHDGNADTGPDREARRVGQPRRAASVDGHVLGGGPEAATVLGLVDEYPFAHPRRIDARANCLDDAGAIAVRYDQAIVQQRRKGAGALLDVGWIHPTGRSQPHQDLPGPGSGLGCSPMMRVSDAGPNVSNHAAFMVNLLRVVLSIQPIGQILGVAVNGDRLARNVLARVRTEVEHHRRDVLRLCETRIELWRRYTSRMASGAIPRCSSVTFDHAVDPRDP